MSQQLDPTDTIATKAFEGFVVRKDLVRKFKGQYPIPTYVAEFLLGRYCASVDEEEIAEGLKIVERQLGEKAFTAGMTDSDLLQLFEVAGTRGRVIVKPFEMRLIPCPHGTDLPSPRDRPIA